MATVTLEERVTTLERRVSELEGQVGFLIPTVRQIHLDLLDFKEQVDRRFDQVDRRFDRLETKVDAMPRAVAEIVVDAMKKQPR
jgi:hypothetical protein